MEIICDEKFEAVIALANRVTEICAASGSAD